MELIQQFQGTLNHGFRGNVIYSFHLPGNCRALSVALSCDKEQFLHKDPSQELISPLYESCYGKSSSRDEIWNLMDLMNAEIQLCLMIDGQFVGNVHMPGAKKELFISSDKASKGCIPCSALKGTAKIIINVFQVLEGTISYNLEIKGDFRHKPSKSFLSDQT
ncbi:MAG TPA: hypothetical protein H9740_08195 [Candidatus Hungatella pullicola]|nr:hypothetical protein [Candidatus Hungatella pullicola]